MLSLKRRFAAEKTNYRKHAKDKEKEIALLKETDDKLKNRLVAQEKYAKAKDFEIAAEHRQTLLLERTLDAQCEKHLKFAQEKDIEIASCMENAVLA